LYPDLGVGIDGPPWPEMCGRANAHNPIITYFLFHFTGFARPTM